MAETMQSGRNPDQDARLPIAGKDTVARDFGGASGSYDGAARLQRHMGQRLLELCLPGSGAGQVLDLGCGTGQFAGELQAHLGAAALTGVDLSESMIRYARAHRPVKASWLVADAEQLPVADRSVDLVFSNLMIQWCADPRPVLRECMRVLKPGGLLVCSTLVDGTLRELAQAWRVVDPGRDHVNRFEHPADLAQMVDEVCPSTVLHYETVRLDYDSPLQLLKELKSLGAQYKGESRRRTVTAPGRMRRLCEAYPGDGNSVQASYEAAYLQCRKV
ncbi:malonyl-ACP O-methyltransferase BioC [Marinobacter sp. SS21]|uniref:malonyl-ACP O-methyltransferase BioC n=1 Tax=Marinobacter sp. SS21 TaxID=2979460 RepID=UPI0023305CA9|nr:malonyl-ACP O-methyltransferase BioC [Marinobacter sp. SS21]MDC0661707.1 malonyl-ACP O-methyltransferase BioC [Marinobacter sp. SS21]